MKSLALATFAAVTLVLPLAAVPPARAADPAKLVAATRTLEREAFAEHLDGLIQARADLEAMSNAEPESAVLHTWMATAAWRLVPRVKDAKQAERFCKDGLRHAEQALKLDSKNAEALALKASLQGMSLRFDPGAMMTIGPEIGSNMNRALQLAPENPRVLLIDAINTANKPAFVGGGADRALPKFKKALERFDTAAAPADSTAPAWGKLDALIWAGRTSADLEDPAAARGYYERALAIDPANGWVRGSLLPALAQPGQAPVEKGKS